MRLNMDLITFWIAVVSFLMSSASWVYTFWENSLRLKVSIKTGFSEGEELFLLLELANESKQPVSITSCSLLVGDSPMMPVGTHSEVVFTYMNPELSGKATERTVRFPLRLDSFEAESIFVRVSDWTPAYNQHIPGQCRLVVRTSRGVKSRCCILPMYCTTWKEILKYIR